MTASGGKPLMDLVSRQSRARDARLRHRVPPPRLYLYFDAIVRQGSIRRAAETLGVASSALNRRLLDLEEDVGAPLFDRLQTGVRLTAAGEIFAAHVRRTLSDAEQAEGRLQELYGTMRGHVTIGAAESAAVDLLPPVIAEFQRLHPGMRFTVIIGVPQELLASLLQDRVDLILTHEEPSRHDVAVLVTARKSFCALMRAGHPLATRKRLLMQDCQDYPIVLAEESLAARALVNATLAGGALSFTPALVTNGFEVMKRYVRLTDAVSFQFHLRTPCVGAADDLVALPLADPQLANAHLSLAVRRGRALPPSAAAVCESLQALLRPPVPR